MDLIQYVTIANNAKTMVMANMWAYNLGWRRGMVTGM